MAVKVDDTPRATTLAPDEIAKIFRAANRDGAVHEPKPKAKPKPTTKRKARAVIAQRPAQGAVETVAVDARPLNNRAIEVTCAALLNAHRVRVDVYDATETRRKRASGNAGEAIRIGKLADFAQPLTIEVLIRDPDGKTIAQGRTSADLR